MTAPARDTSTWPTQTEAAVRLATNERTIRRFIAAGRLRAEKRPVVGAKPQTVIDPADVARVRAEREREKPVVIAAPGRDHDTDHDTYHDRSEVTRIEPAAAALAELFAGAARALADAQAKPVRATWLTLAEAAEASGLPESWLREYAKRCLDDETRGAGLQCGVLDVGKRKGGRWRFRRDSL